MYYSWINKSLPLQVLIDLWKKTEGNNLEKTIKLGFIREEDIRYLRVMGGDSSRVNAPMFIINRTFQFIDTRLNHKNSAKITHNFVATK